MVNFFRKFKLGTKIFFGYGIILLLLALLMITQLFNINWFQTNFHNYSDMAKHEMLAGRIQANLLESRIAYKNYYQHGDDRDRLTFLSRFEKMERFIYQLKEEVDSIDREIEINQILELSKDYHTNVLEIVESKEKKDELYQILYDLGPQIENNMEKVLNEFYIGDMPKEANEIELTIKHLLLGRLKAAKYLENHDDSFIMEVNQELQTVRSHLDNLNQNNLHTEIKFMIQTIENELNLYLNSFNQISTIIEERIAINQRLEVIGPNIAKHAENIKLSIIEEQDTFLPKIKSESMKVISRIIGISLLALLFAIIISIRVTKIIVQPIKIVTNTFREISEGEADLKVRMRAITEDEIGDMSRNFNIFMDKLNVIMKQIANQNWIKTGQAELSEVIRKEKELEILCKHTLSYLVQYLNAHIGAIYTSKEDKNYQLVGSYALDPAIEILKEIKPGIGVIGQAILHKQIYIMEKVPAEYFIRTALGEGAPVNLVIVPCVINDEIKCIIEIGSLEPFQELHLEFMKEIQEAVAISIRSLEENYKRKELLDKTLAQSEELQVQQEELRQSNEELEEQTRALKESEERLQAQQEELRVTNEELLERSLSLEQQTNEINKKNQILLKAQEEIQEKAEALEQANKYKSEFLANMSHELRTPLNSILVLSQLLANKNVEEPFTSKQIQYATTIHKAGSDLLRLIDDILDISKVEAGKLSIVMEEVDIHEVCRNIENIFKPIATEKGLNFIIDLNQDLPKNIITDSQRLQQILNNLLSNALKFTENGKVELSVYLDKAHVEANGHKNVVFCVTDSGIGIPYDKQGLIFEAFKQSDGTISRKYGGTGLGLYITKELVELLGGSIHLESQLEKGSKFTFVLPMKVNANPLNSKTETVTAQEQERNKTELLSTTETRRKTLLIIEDDENFSNILKDIAKDQGYQCYSTNDGSTGIQLAKELKPNAILLDIGLPDMDGWKVAEILRDQNETKDIPVHVISGNELDKEEEYKNGIIGYLQKPISLTKIQDILKYLDQMILKEIKKVLLIDSDTSQIKNVVDILEKRDVLVDQVESGKKVFDLIKKNAYDCIILDLNLPDMTGFDLLAKLREDYKVSIPVIIYTEKEFTKEEESQLKKQAECIIIKGRRSIERLVDEVNMFLFHLNTSIENDQHVINNMRDKSFSNKKILIVDDDMRNVFALTGILEEMGIQVIVGRNGKEGLDKVFQNTDIDLILMDIMMPEMDGYTAMREIRKEPKYKNLPIVALTAKAMLEDRNKCIEAGANEYVTKPIDVNKLISVLKVWLH